MQQSCLLQQSIPMHQSSLYPFYLFRARLRDSRQFTKCRNTSTHSELFEDVQLNIENIKTIEDALERFFAQETFQGDNSYDCKRCHQKTKAVKKLQFNNLPPLLTLQLKRFSFSKFSGNLMHKFNHDVKFPYNIDLSKYNQSTTAKNPVTQRSSPVPKHLQKIRHTIYMASLSILVLLLIQGTTIATFKAQQTCSGIKWMILLYRRSMHMRYSLQKPTSYFIDNLPQHIPVLTIQQFHIIFQSRNIQHQLINLK